MDAISITDWSGYLAARAGAGETLTGLVFVSVSINLSRVLSVPGLSGRAAESLKVLGAEILVSGSPAGLYWAAPGFTFSLVAGITSSWILLVEILR